MSNDTAVQAECEKSPNGKHDPVSPPSGSVGHSTAMGGCMNRGSWSVICSWCGIAGALMWHEEEQHIEGKGPFAKRCVRVDDEVRWDA